jgi:hypothetical protein
MTATKTATRNRRGPTPTRTNPSANGLSMTTIEDKVAVLILTVHAPYNQRSIGDKSIIVTDADKSRLNVVKRLFDSPEHKAIEKVGYEVRSYISRMALPSPFKEGTYAIPFDLLTAVDEKLREFEAQRTTLVGKLQKEWDEVLDSARRKLGSHFKASDYPPVEALPERYRLSWQYVSLSAPTQIRSIDEALFTREQRRLKEQWDTAIDDMRDALRLGLQELIDDMVQRLTNVEEAEGKRFKPSKLLERFDEFLGTFDARNVTSDEQLKELAQKARKILKGANTETLTQSEDIRTRIKKEFKMVQGELSKLEVESKSRRRITFTDE